MLTTLLGFAPVMGAVITALVAIGSAWYGVYTARKAAENTPEMKANAQAKVDLGIEEQAEAAVNASDKGNLSAERIGDAE